jgi:hypothetical protein
MDVLLADPRRHQTGARESPEAAFADVARGNSDPPSPPGTAERRPKLVGWLIVVIIVLAIIGLVAVVRAVL